MTPGEGRRQGLVALAAAAAVVLLATVVAWGSVAGPSEVFTGPGPLAATGVTTQPESSAPTATATATPRPPPPGDRRLPGWAEGLLDVVAWTLAAVVLALVGYVLRRAVLAWLGRHREEPDGAVDVAVLPAAAATDAAARRAAERERLLGEGPARDAIIACWQDLEVDAARAGLRREAWETPTEFCRRLLDDAGAPADAVDSLARLYREARFSEHALGEPKREAARAALRRIHAGLGRGVAQAGAGPS